MLNSKQPGTVRKPRPDFPLFPHATGRWAKKVKGNLCYFGKTAEDPQGEAALLLWLEQKDDLLAGRKPRPKTDGLTVKELCNRFLTAKTQQRDSGEITGLTFNDYKRSCDRILAVFGSTRSVNDLASDDFESLRASIAKTNGPVSLGNEIQRIRVVFKYAYDASLIDRPMRYGPLFKRPSKKVLRLDRAEKGPRMFEAGQIRTLIDAADVQLKAMILLGINCGFGNADCGTLPLTAIDLDRGWINYHRQKTGIDRRCPLWPETVEAIKAAITARPEPKGDDAKLLVFVTKYGAPWFKGTTDKPISKEFKKVIDAAKLYRPGVGFYTLRHAFRTIADGSLDQVAVNSIMGHADASMAGAYRERIDDKRLRAVVNVVRAWLFKKTAKPAKGKNQSRRKSADVDGAAA